MHGKLSYYYFYVYNLFRRFRQDDVFQMYRRMYRRASFISHSHNTRPNWNRIAINLIANLQLLGDTALVSILLAIKKHQSFVNNIDELFPRLKPSGLRWDTDKDGALPPSQEGGSCTPQAGFS